MSVFDFFCFYCGQRLSADTPDVGALTECPVCRNRFNIPAPPRSSAALTPIKVEPQKALPAINPNSVFEFRCPACTQPLSATVKDAGHDVACPACDTIFVIPKPNTGALAAQLAGNPAKPSIMPAPPRIDSGVNPIPNLHPTPPTTGGAAKQGVTGGFVVVDGKPMPKPPAATPLTPNPPLTPSRSTPPTPPPTSSPFVPSKPPVTTTGKPGTSTQLPTGKELLAGAKSTPPGKKPASTPATPVSGRQPTAPHRPPTGKVKPTPQPPSKALPPDMNMDLGVVPVDVEAEPMEAEPVAVAVAVPVPTVPTAPMDNPLSAMDPFAAGDSLFAFDDSAPTADTALSELPDWRREFAQREGRRMSSGSVQVLPTGSEMMFALATGKTVEDLSDAHAKQLAQKAARIALEDMAATPDCCALLDPPSDSLVQGAPRPQFLAYLRPEPTNTKDAWVFVFLAAHVIAYKVQTREEFVCRSPELSLDVRFKPGVAGKSKTHLGFRLTKNDASEVCKLSLTFQPNGPLALSARDFALQIKGWIRAHPVLGRRVEADLLRATEARKGGKPTDGGTTGSPYLKGRTQ